MSDLDRPLIQVGDTVRPMTDEEYDALLATGWTPDGDPNKDGPG